MYKNAVWMVAKYVLALLVLATVFYWNWESADGRGLGDVWRVHFVEGRPVAWSVFSLAVLVHGIGLVAILLRWYVLVRAQDLPFTLAEAFRLGTFAMLCNAFLPGSVGGDLVKATSLARGQERRTVAVATVVMDRFISLWALVLLVASAGVGFWTFNLIEETALGAARVVIVACAVSVVLSIAIWIAMGLRPAERAPDQPLHISSGPMAQLGQAVWLYRSRPASLGWAVALSTLSNLCEVSAFYGYARAFWDGSAQNPLPSFADHCLLVPVGLVISAVPLFPGGAGVGEAGFGGLYRVFNSAPANGVVGSLLFRVSGWCLGILGYILCSSLNSSKPSVVEPTSDQSSP